MKNNFLRLRTLSTENSIKRRIISLTFPSTKSQFLVCNSNKKFQSVINRSFTAEKMYPSKSFHWSKNFEPLHSIKQYLGILLFNIQYYITKSYEIIFQKYSLFLKVIEIKFVIFCFKNSLSLLIFKISDVISEMT